jgi:hypothetical protein
MAFLYSSVAPPAPLRGVSAVMVTIWFENGITPPFRGAGGAKTSNNSYDIYLVFILFIFINLLTYLRAKIGSNLLYIRKIFICCCT